MRRRRTRWHPRVLQLRGSAASLEPGGVVGCWSGLTIRAGFVPSHRHLPLCSRSFTGWAKHHRTFLPPVFAQLRSCCAPSASALQTGSPPPWRGQSRSPSGRGLSTNGGQAFSLSLSSLYLALATNDVAPRLSFQAVPAPHHTTTRRREQLPHRATRRTFCHGREIGLNAKGIVTMRGKQTILSNPKVSTPRHALRAARCHFCCTCAAAPMYA